MANGRKNYFRHSFSAFEDEKIQKAISLLGYEGYAYYFILIEMLARQCENEFKNPIKIHQQSLRNVWRKQTKSCKKVVEKLQESGLFVATFKESFVEFDIPNLSKYLGKYTNKNLPNASNKSKVNEIKEKESGDNSPGGQMGGEIFTMGKNNRADRLHRMLTSKDPIEKAALREELENEQCN